MSVFGDDDSDDSADEAETTDIYEDPEDVIDKGAGVKSSEDVDRSIDLNALAETVRRTRKARGEVDGLTIDLTLHHFSDDDKTGWKVRAHTTRPISAEYDERLEQAMVRDSTTMERTQTFEHELVAHRVFEDTKEKYGLEEVTDPDVDIEE